MEQNKKDFIIIGLFILVLIIFIVWRVIYPSDSDCWEAAVEGTTCKEPPPIYASIKAAIQYVR